MENKSPVFCGIDISSDISKCAIAIGEASIENNKPVLRVKLRESNEQPGDDWDLPTVAAALGKLLSECKQAKRQAIVAIDIPFGYPKAFAQYLNRKPLESKGFTETIKMVDDLMFRGCEKKLKDSLLSPNSWETPERKPLWDYYQSLRTKYFSADDPKKKAEKLKDGSPKKSNMLPVSPLSTVSDKIGRAVARWIRVACELNARAEGPSVWSIDNTVYVFECYPLASLVSCGLWHPDLKSSERGQISRAAAINLLKAQTISFPDEAAPRNCFDWWGNVECDDMTESDHTFDALVCTCTAWWCGHSVLSKYNVNNISDYPKPESAGVPEESFTDPADKHLDVDEGGIYYPKTPACLLNPGQ
jgi:hypothetical protein